MAIQKKSLISSRAVPTQVSEQLAANTMKATSLNFKSLKKRAGRLLKKKH